MNKKYLPSAERLQHKVGPILELHGFRLINSQLYDGEQFFEVLIYQRPNPNWDKPDKIGFQAEYGISGELHSRGIALLNMKQLLPNYHDLSFPESQFWLYNDEETLMLRLEEIAQFVERFLLPWFLNPNSNLGKIAYRISEASQFDLEKEQIEYIASLEVSIALARKEKDFEIAEIYENEVKKLKESLSPNETKDE